MKMIQISLEGVALKVPEQTNILALVAGKSDLGLQRPIGAMVNNSIAQLDSSLYEGAQVRFITIESEAGQEIYRRGCSLLLLDATRRIFPDARLVVGQSLDNGYYFDWLGQPKLEAQHLVEIKKEMLRMVAADLPFDQERCGVETARQRFNELGLADRVELLSTFWHQTIQLVKLGSIVDVVHGPFPPSTGYLPYFGLSLYPPGFVLRFPHQSADEPLDQPPQGQTKLFDIHRQTKDWNRKLGIENVGELNRACLTDVIEEAIRVSEGFHEKRIAEIADTITRNRDRSRIVLIAGPSSSGKTTFLKRLSVQLKVNGVTPVGLSIDNYYLSRERTPKDEKGEPDFESIDAIDLELFNQHLLQLLSGKEVATPRFSFGSGQRRPPEKSITLCLRPEDVLMVEGIHGLNDRLTAQVPAKTKYKIYISALTQLCLDDTNRIHTTDGRLLRRIVRDRLYRGYNASQTLALWPSVRRGEHRNIFPFQESADDIFNTALPYEMAVLKIFAERFLVEVPRNDPTYAEVHRLMKFLDMFVGIFPYRVPQNSILREFIGGSTFRY
jgi:uridine kinase